MEKCPKCGREVPTLTLVIDTTVPPPQNKGKMCCTCAADLARRETGISINNSNNDKNKKKWQFWK